MNTSSKAGRSLGCFSYLRGLTFVAGGRDIRPSPQGVPVAMMFGVATPEEG